MAEPRDPVDVTAHLAALAEAAGIVVLTTLDVHSTRQRLAEHGLDASALPDARILDLIKDAARADDGCLLATEIALEGRVDRAVADALGGGGEGEGPYTATFEARELDLGVPRLAWANVQWPVHHDEITDLTDSFETLRLSRHAPQCVREWQGPCVVTLNGCDTFEELRREEQDQQHAQRGGREPSPLARAMTRESKAKAAHAAATADMRATLQRLDHAAAREQDRMTSPTWTDAETARRLAKRLRELADEAIGKRDDLPRPE